MKQSDNKQKKSTKLRKIISIIGATIGLATVLYKMVSIGRKKQTIHTDKYIPIGSNTNPDEERVHEEIAVTKEINHLDDEKDCIEEQEGVFEKFLQDILHYELPNAKKVWVTYSNQEEIQVEKHIFEEDGHFFLGNSNKYIKLLDIYKLKYRSKIYFDRDSSNH